MQIYQILSHTCTQQVATEEEVEKMKILILLAVLPMVFGIDNHERCDAGTYPETVSIAGCAQAPCEMREGETISVVVVVRGERNSNKLTTKVTLINDAGETNLPVPPRLEEGCDMIDEDCPVEAGKLVTFRFQVALINLQNQGLLKLKFELVGDSGPAFLCSIVEFEVIRSKTPQLL